MQQTAETRVDNGLSSKFLLFCTKIRREGRGGACLCISHVAYASSLFHISCQSLVFTLSRFRRLFMQYLCDGGEAVLKRLYSKLLKNPTTVAETTDTGHY